MRKCKNLLCFCHGACTSAPPSSHWFTRWECTATQIETPICTRRTTHSSSDNNNICAVHWADHQWNAEWLENTTRLRTFIADISTHPPEMALPIKRGTRLTASAPMSDVSAPAYTNGLWPLLRPVSESQKNKPPTMLSYNVQSTDLPMDCTTWRFWMMRQSNGCSTPAPGSSAANQCILTTRSDDERMIMEDANVIDNFWNYFTTTCSTEK